MLKKRREVFYVSREGLFPGYVDPRGYSGFYDNLDENGLPVFGLKQAGDHLLELANEYPEQDWFIVREISTFENVGRAVYEEKEGTDEMILVVEYSKSVSI